VIERERVFRGEVFQLPGNGAPLARVARDHARAAFECDLQRLHERFSPAQVWERTCAARRALAADRRALEAASELALSFGFVRGSLAMDAPRLRVVEPGAHTRQAATRAFYAHRDTWYGCSRAQLNVWIPLYDVDERDSLALYTCLLGVPVMNDSDAFDYAAFASEGGFQSASLLASTYPRCLETLPDEAHRIRAPADSVVVFSAAHLHRTTPNETGRTRLSVDVRFVDLEDEAQGGGAADPDNRSRGSALRDYVRPS
jgi:hypothetical protein